MRTPCYIDLEQARLVLSEMGVEITKRQMKRATETDAQGRRRRKLPFFIDPIEGKLKIEKGAIVDIYRTLQEDAKQRIGD